MDTTNKGGRAKVSIRARNAWTRYRPRRRGRLKSLAETLGISRSAVCGWRHVPAERLEAVAAWLKVPREALRPDLFIEPPKPKPPQANPWLSA